MIRTAGIRGHCKLGLAALLLALVSCENDIHEIQRLTEFDKLPDQTVLQSHIVYTDSGRVQFKISAGKIDRYLGDEPRDEFSDGVRVLSYDKSGKLETQIDALNATNFPNKKIMIARDKVILKGVDQKTLETEMLTWDENNEKVYTDKFVKITTPTEILFGDGLEAAQDFSSYEILNIKGRITVQDDEDQTTNP